MDFPRLLKRDVEAMVRIHTAIAAAHAALGQSSWSGRALVINVIEQADLLISELFNRCEIRMTRDPATIKRRKKVNDRPALTAQVESNGNLDPDFAGKERV